jgi:hypothetical protein
MYVIPCPLCQKYLILCLKFVVHILSGDLILHKRTLEPIKTLIYGLRRYDVDRCAALVDSSDPTNADVRVVGFMSHKSKIYLVRVLQCPPGAMVDPSKLLRQTYLTIWSISSPVLTCSLALQRTSLTIPLM